MNLDHHLARMQPPTPKRKAYTTTRDVTPDECHWLDATVPTGAVVYRCVKPTYGCVRDFAATFDPHGGYPFFELPRNAIAHQEAVSE